MSVLSVVTWKWQNPGYRSHFTSAHVNTLYRMVKRHYADGHRTICVTDDPAGLDPHIEVVPLWKEWADIPSPYGGHNPSCYRRLKMFSPQAGKLFGERFVSIDLDTVITGNLRHLWNRPEDFVMWDEQDPRSFYNGSMCLMTAGSRPQVWDRFDPLTSPQKAKADGKFGSDQGWISYVLKDGEAVWTKKDGVYSYRLDIHPKPRRELPSDARIVMWHGGMDPWGKPAQRIPWVKAHYR